MKNTHTRMTSFHFCVLSFLFPFIYCYSICTIVPCPSPPQRPSSLPPPPQCPPCGVSRSTTTTSATARHGALSPMVGWPHFLSQCCLIQSWYALVSFHRDMEVKRNKGSMLFFMINNNIYLVLFSTVAINHIRSSITRLSCPPCQWSAWDHRYALHVTFRYSL